MKSTCDSIELLKIWKYGSPASKISMRRKYPCGMASDTSENTIWKPAIPHNCIIVLIVVARQCMQCRNSFCTSEIALPLAVHCEQNGVEWTERRKDGQTLNFFSYTILITNMFLKKLTLVRLTLTTTPSTTIITVQKMTVTEHDWLSIYLISLQNILK